MLVTKDERADIRTEDQVVRVRQMVRQWATELGFSLVDLTKFVTAASELARNTVIHGGGGTVDVQVLQNDGRRGLRVVFQDEGPGIGDLELAMRDGYTTGNGLGLGLSGARRLVNDFEIDSRPGEGTRVAITRWK
jgi:serine/threonine-protein kinase RsbT